MRRVSLLSLCLLVCSLGAADTVDMHGVRLPTGFTLSEFADGKLANDIHCLTVDPKGRVVVSGRGYIRILLDDDKDGKADRALDFAAAPKDGAHGLFWEKDDLYCVGDGGLRVYRNATGEGRNRPSEILFRCRTGGEHLSHAVARGPDGWLYLIAGDGAQIKGSNLLPTSPIKDLIGGCVVRFPPNFKGYEIVAHGFRNPYGMDFNSDGEVFTYDSDNERCVSLPWYEFTRAYHVVPGAHHGWMNPQFAATWRRPPYFLDVVAPLSYLNRGSPTGVMCYRHAQFPAKYRGGMFMLDWTFGIVYFLPLTPEGSTYRTTPEVFLRSVGDNGFAPTATAVHPLTGDMYLSIGGRGTRGAVYRIRHEDGLKSLKFTDVARYQFKPRSLDWKPGTAAILLKQAGGKDLHAKRRALELIHRHRAHFTAKELETVLASCADETDLRIRQATARLLATLEPTEQQRLSKRLTSPLQQTTRYLATPSLEAMSLVRDSSLPIARRIEGIRLVQLALGDLTAKGTRGNVREGYSRRGTTPIPNAISVELRKAFPSGDTTLDRELSRTLAMLEDDNVDFMERVTQKWSAKSDPVEDIHYLIVLSRLKGPRSSKVTQAVAATILALDRKLDERKMYRERNWLLRMAELHGDLAARDPKLNTALVSHPEFGRPDHALWCQGKGFDRKRAAEVFLKRSEKEDFIWSAELIGLIKELPATRALPVLRKLWGKQGLDEVILPILAKYHQPDDLPRLLTGLTSARLATVKSAVGAVEKYPTPNVAALREQEAVALVKGMRLLPTGKEEGALRKRLLTRLQTHTTSKLADTQAALTWLSKTYPEAAKTLGDAEGVDVAGWRKRLTAVNWDKGDAKQGQNVYIKASCASCHAGVAALGPDLRGVTGRFSRDDLFTAILQPSKDVSPRYRTTQLTTSAGQVYQGIIVYEAMDSVLMLTGPGQNIRLAHKQINERQLTTRSLMPSGLLDRLKDEEVADLYAYLKSLGSQP